MEASILISADGSDSISPSDFLTQMEFIKQVQSLSGGTNLLFGVHIFSSSIASAPDGTITINSRSPTRFARLVDRLIQPQQGTDTALAIRQAVRALNRANPTSKNLIIITDGQSRNEAETFAEATIAKDEHGINIIAIGVGANVNMDELRLISAVSFEVSDFDTLNTVISTIQESVCVGKCTSLCDIGG